MRKAPLTAARCSRVRVADELSKLVAQHEKSKRELVKPVKEMISANPNMKKALTLLTGLLSDSVKLVGPSVACTACSGSRHHHHYYHHPRRCPQ